MGYQDMSFPDPDTCPNCGRTLTLRGTCTYDGCPGDAAGDDPSTTAGGSPNPAQSDTQAAEQERLEISARLMQINLEIVRLKEEEARLRARLGHKDR